MTTISRMGWLAMTMWITAAAALPLNTARAATHLNGGWLIVPGSDPLERLAAEELQREAAEQHGIELRIAPGSASGDASGGHSILIGTPKDHPAIRDEHQARAFTLGEDAESYHLALRGENLFIVGNTPKGAMNGAFRLLDRGTLDVAGLDEAKSPAFQYRIGGHKLNQHPPADWSEEEQARYYARHYINVVWGEKLGPPMSYESRRKYGLGLMVEVRFPPVDKKWMDDPANASAVYRESAKKQRRVVSPFDPRGREAHLEAFRRVLKENPDTKILYAVFADYNAIPNEESINVATGRPHGKTRAEGMKEILGLMREAIGDRPPEQDIWPVAWLWHGFFGQPQAERQFMLDIAASGYGALYNEHGNDDCWIFRENNFNATALPLGEDGRVIYGPRYIPLVSNGGACESTRPVLGFPLPRVAAVKTRLMADAGVRNFAIWWAGCEGWVYQPNVEVLREMIWNPEAYDLGTDDPFAGDAPSLLQRIAVRDFGAELAPAVLDFWAAFDRALVTRAPIYKSVDQMPPPDQDGLHIYDWYQRLGIFRGPAFGGPYRLPLTPSALANRQELRKERHWAFHPDAMKNYEVVLGRLAEANQKLEPLLQRERSSSLSPEAVRRISDMYHWAELYRLLLTSQHNYFRAINVLRELGEATTPEAEAELRTKLRPILNDEITNDEALINLISGGYFPSNFNIYQSMQGVIKNQGSIESEVETLRHKIQTMREYLASDSSAAAHRH